MGGKYSRNKGANFERKVAKTLSDWSGLELRRTPLSGGWAKHNPNAVGDIACIDIHNEFPLCVECKCGQGWELESVFRGKCKLFESWWKQATDNCPAGKIPVLIFSKNYSEDWVMLQRVDLPKVDYNINCIVMDERVIIALNDLLQIPMSKFIREQISDHRNDI